MCIYLSVFATYLCAIQNICNVYRCDIYLYVCLYLYICMYVSICMCYICICIYIYIYVCVIQNMYMYIYLYVYLDKSTSVDNNVPLNFIIIIIVTQQNKVTIFK